MTLEIHRLHAFFGNEEEVRADVSDSREHLPTKASRAGLQELEDRDRRLNGQVKEKENGRQRLARRPGMVVDSIWNA